MFEPTAIFQRTEIGRDEIYEKKRGLTQSERLVLIMIDGITPYREVRTKLPVLTDDRFQRALTTLYKKDLVIEVFLQVEGAEPEQVEQTVIDRFIQQDPTDPLTIISFDPEEDFGVFGPPVSAQPSANVVVQAETAFTSVRAEDGSASVSQLMDDMTKMATQGAMSGGAMDEALIQQADALAEEVRAKRVHYENPIERVQDHLQRQHERHSYSERKRPENAVVEKLHWGYWMIAVGMAFIVGFFAARLTH